MDKKLKKEKNRCGKICDIILEDYDKIKEMFLPIIVFILCWGFIQNHITYLIGSGWRAIIIVCLMSIIIYWIDSKNKKAINIIPYKKTNHFIGLYNIDGTEQINNDNNRGLISRNDEIKHLMDKVSDLFKSTSVSRSVCMVGKSGSGKSTILNMFAYFSGESYRVVNFTGKYKFIDTYVDEELSGYKDGTVKYVAIFDQFEEFFLAFVEEFNNHILMNVSHDDNYGVLSDRNADFSFILCKGLENESKVIEGLIRQAFGDVYYKSIVNYIKDNTLIHQEIVLNLLENEKEASRDYTKYIEYEEIYIMERYFDVQLCSTGDYFDASRIMYLLCVGRLNNICFTKEYIKEALCIYNDRERKKLMIV